MSRSMLIVDDEETIRWALGELFMADGWQVDYAADGDEADRLVELNDYHFMITDLKMPGVSGIELVRKARQRNPRVGVVILTGYASLETAIEALRLRAWDYVTKPFDVRYLRGRVEAFVKGAGGWPADHAGPAGLSEEELEECPGGAVEILSLPNVHPDEPGHDGLDRVKGLLDHLGLDAERCSDLVQVCLEAIALVGGEEGARVSAGLLAGHLVLAVCGEGGPGRAGEVLERVRAELGVDARLVGTDGDRRIVICQKIRG